MNINLVYKNMLCFSFKFEHLKSGSSAVSCSLPAGGQIKSANSLNLFSWACIIAALYFAENANDIFVC